jgi:DNA-binding transcriptional ArsR family regulator
LEAGLAAHDECFTPEPFQLITDRRQLKAFTDARRARMLHILADREATNQQLAATLGQPQGKVLYHVRVLLDAGLIRLVREEVNGGNVEKYYRATARLFGLRPDHAGSFGMAATALEAVAQEVASAERWHPQVSPDWEIRHRHLDSQRVAEFQDRLRALIAEYWGGPATTAPETPDAPLMAFAAVTYRAPSGE